MASPVVADPPDASAPRPSPEDSATATTAQVAIELVTSTTAADANTDPAAPVPLQSRTRPRPRTIGPLTIPPAEMEPRVIIGTMTPESRVFATPRPATPNANPPRCSSPCSAQYWQKWRGVPGKSAPSRVPWSDTFWSFLGAIVGMSIVCAVHYEAIVFQGSDLAMVMGSLGASAVLLYGAPASPLAQPWNLVAGHVVSALIGVLCRLILVDSACHDHCLWVAGSTAVALSISVMQMINALHPPGGATALLAVIGEDRLVDLGFLYIVLPSLTGPLILLLVALVVNNLEPQRNYPVYWW